MFSKPNVIRPRNLRDSIRPRALHNRRQRARSPYQMEMIFGSSFKDSQSLAKMKVFFFILLLTFLLRSNFEDVHAIIYEAPHRHTNLEAMHCELESINNCKKIFFEEIQMLV